MKTIKTLFLSMVCIGLTVTGRAQVDGSVKSFSLKEAQDYAVQNNDSLKLASKDVEISKKQVKETTALGLPQVSGKVDFQYFFDIPTQLLPDFVSPAVYGILLQEGVEIMTDPNNIPDGGMTPAQFGTNYNISAGLSVNQLIFDGQYIVGLKASKAVKDLSKSMLNTNEVNVRASVAKMYLQTLVLSQTQDLLNKNKDELDKNITEMTAMVKEGLTDQLDLDRLTLTKQRIDNQIKNIEHSHALVKLLLKLQMGYPVEDPIDLSDNIDQHLSTEALSTTETANAASRPEYQTLVLNRELQRLDMQRWRAGYLPQLVGFFSYSQNALVNEFDQVNNGDNWFPTSLVGVTLNVPIFDGLSKSAKTQQSKLNMEKAEINLHQFEQSVALQVQQSQNNYQLAKIELDTEKKNLDLAQRIYDRSKVLYDEGVGSSFEMTAALTDLYTAQTSYLQASYKLISAQINLEKALGKYN